MDNEHLNDVFARFQEAMQMNWSALAHITGKPSELEAALHKKLKKGCKDAFKQYARIYENHFHSWVVVIEKFLTKSYLVDKANWNYLKKARFAKYCKKSNLQWLVGKYFDVLSWSMEYSKIFPFIFSCAIIWISPPATNAFQERVFLLLSWFDSNWLMHHQTVKTFEMRVLECICRQLRKYIVNTEKESAQIKKDSGHEIIELLDKDK